ncbi:hypothetical protein AMTRI_Chr13g118970 [Amborella trichopoda]
MQGFRILVAFSFLCVLSEASDSLEQWSGNGKKFIFGEESLAPWAMGLLHFAPASGPAYGTATDLHHSLILAKARTKRPDMLHRFRRYQGGWDITNKHYWASVGFTGAAGFVLAFLWFISFGVALLLLRCCRWSNFIRSKGSRRSCWISLTLLLIFTCVTIVGCIFLSVGQDDFHGEMMDTLNFVVNQSDFTVQKLRNVTEFLSLAKSINVDQVFLPSNDKDEIDKLNGELDNAASTLTEKTSENSERMKRVLNAVRWALIVVATVMLLLSLLGLILSMLGYQHAIYTFILSGWLLVALTFILCGVFVILDNAITDTCVAMKEWVDNPQAETALSDILPCVDEKTTNRTLYQSKEVIYQLVKVVNTAIYTFANNNPPPNLPPPYYYNQSGPLMPPLCSPFDSQLNDKDCAPQEVSFDNASQVWQNYKCMVSSSGLCITTGRVTADAYDQLVLAVNVSYALYHYSPFLLSLQDCHFVRETFTTITSVYCPSLEHHLKLVNAGLALISVGIMLCLVLWICYANRPQREEVFVKLAVRKAFEDSSIRNGAEP